MIDRLKSIIKLFSGKEILVLGDIMVDEYIWGKVDRISPEAPVPVVLENKRQNRPGGALNVANNLTSLGARPYITGVIGNDAGGKYVREYLKDSNIDSDGIFRVDTRPTTLKTRIIGNSQQIVRLDIENTKTIDESITEKIIDYVDSKLKNLSAVIVSDYNKGVLNERILSKLAELKDRGIIIAVDPQIRHFMMYKNATIITPNHHEAGEAAGIRIEDDETLKKAANKIIESISPELLLVTLGENGMKLFKKDGFELHVPTVAKHVYDVTGAGDTVISVFTLCVVCGANYAEAAIISNVAAGCVVEEMGTVAISREKLLSRITRMSI